jgi:hypothetical protein
MQREWSASARPYRETTPSTGTNPWLQRWLQHPPTSAWQSMVPYEGASRASISRARIMATTTTADRRPVHRQHLASAETLEHYPVIAPTITGARVARKTRSAREYTIDPVAQIDWQELKLAFMDYVLKGKPKPALLKDKINYEVMGANRWRHSTSLGSVHGGVPMRLYFSSQKSEGLYSLANQQPPSDSLVTHEVDFVDRVNSTTSHSYPNPIVQGPLSYVTESIF